MKSINKLLILLTVFSLVACFEDPGTDIVWGDKALLELDRAGLLSSSPTVDYTYNRLNDGTKYPLNVQVNLMGKPQPNAVNATYEIEAVSTAVSGFHYNKLSAGNTITIPAGSNTANINLEVIADNINPGEIWTVVVKITGGDLPLSSYTRATFRLRTLCPFNRANFVGLYAATEPGYGTYDVALSATSGDANSVTTDNFWDFGGVLNYTFVQNPSTLVWSLTLPTQNVVMGGTTYTVSQNGGTSFNACGTTFVVPYRVVRTSDGAVFDVNTHTYNRK